MQVREIGHLFQLIMGNIKNFQVHQAAQSYQCLIARPCPNISGAGQIIKWVNIQALLQGFLQINITNIQSFQKLQIFNFENLLYAQRRITI